MRKSGKLSRNAVKPAVAAPSEMESGTGMPNDLA